MANLIDNELKIIGSDSEVKKVLEYINGYSKSDEMHIDFNKIVPMPEEVKNTEKNGISEAINILIFDYGKDISESEIKARQNYIKVIPINEIKDQRQNIKMTYENTIKYGYSNWNDWSIANWGTKWNAYRQNKDDDNRIHFCTAWASARHLILKLSELFPKVTMKYTFRDIESNADYDIYETYEMKGGRIKYFKEICDKKAY